MSLLSRFVTSSRVEPMVNQLVDGDDDVVENAKKSLSLFRELLTSIEEPGGNNWAVLLPVPVRRRVPKAVHQVGSRISRSRDVSMVSG